MWWWASEEFLRTIKWTVYTNCEAEGLCFCNFPPKTVSQSPRLGWSGLCLIFSAVPASINSAPCVYLHIITKGGDRVRLCTSTPFPFARAQVCCGLCLRTNSDVLEDISVKIRGRFGEFAYHAGVDDLSSPWLCPLQQRQDYPHCTGEAAAREVGQQIERSAGLLAAATQSG